MEKKTNNTCIHIFVIGKRKGETCNKFCRKPRESGKCYAHSPRKQCPHNKLKSVCKECGGGSFCIHDKLKSRCKECGGGSFCIHDKCRNICKICNFNGYIRDIISSRITQALKNVDEKGGYNRLGCTIDEFVNYIDMQLENQKTPDDRVKMDWDNYADVWEFDHIVPILHGNFKNLTVETILERLHYENIQPLYIDLNQKKGNRM